MIDIEEARRLAVSVPVLDRTERLALAHAWGRYLAEDVHSPIAHPPFDNSAVDGYAFRFKDMASPLSVVAEIPAGNDPKVTLGRNECARIFTGAKVPADADTVVMQEHTTARDGIVTIHDARLRQGGNIRRKGEQLAKGALALPKGAPLNAASIGHLAGLGVQHVHVVESPRVAIAVTGSEFAEQESDLDRGRIFESNGIMLASALRELGITALHDRVVDDRQLLTAHLRKLAEANDLLLVTGGVSVGDFDFTRAALEDNGFEVVFHNVHQQPGKPLLFMRRGKQLAFGLPGNPRSVLVCYHTYVVPCIRKLKGAADPLPQWMSLPIAKVYTKKQERPQLLTASLTANGILIGDWQNSHMLGTFAGAEVLVHLPAGSGQWNPGDPVEVQFL